MNPELPRTPREEMELRLSALLLGELSAAEAAVVREALVKDPELAKLHDDLKETIHLVREATASASEQAFSETTPPKLSEMGRKKLLTAFAIPPLKESDRKPKPLFQMRLIEVLAMVAIVGVLAAMLFSSVGRMKSRGMQPVAVTRLPASSAPRPTFDSLAAEGEKLPAESAPALRGQGPSNVYSVNVVGHFNVNASTPSAGRGEGSALPSTDMARAKPLVVNGSVAEDGRSANYPALLPRESSVAATTPAPAPARPPPAVQIVLPAANDSTEGESDSLERSKAFSARYGARQRISPAARSPVETFASRGVTLNFTNLAAVGDLASDGFAYGEFAGASGSGGGGGRSAGGFRFLTRTNSYAADDAFFAPPPSGENVVTLDSFAVVPSTPAIDPATGLPMADESRLDRADGGVSIPSRLYLPGVVASTTAPVTNLGSLQVDVTRRFAEVDGDKAPVLGNLPLLGKLYKSEPKPTPGFVAGLFSYETNASFRQLATLGTETVGLDSTNVGLFDAQSLNKSGDGALTLSGESSFSGGTLAVGGMIASNDPPQVAWVGTLERPAQTTVEGKLVQDRELLLESGQRDQPEAKVRAAERLRELASKDFTAKAEQKSATPNKSEVYFAKKRELEQLQQSARILNTKLAAETVDLSLPKTSMVEILDRATPAREKTGFWRSLGAPVGGAFASTARVKVERDVSDLQGLQQESHMNLGYDPYFIQTEFEAIQSEQVLGEVVDSLGLDQAWAKNGRKLKKAEAVAQLKAKLDVKPVANTGLVEVRAIDADANEAAKIANAVAETYATHRLRERTRLTAGGIKLLNARDQEQQQKIAAAQKELDRLRTELAISEAEAGGTTPISQIHAASAPAVEPDASVVRKPSTNAPIPQPEIQASENNFSTFSLNVSDVSFKLAAASLEKGQMPDAASVRCEEFINAFDYRDPEPPPGAPIAFAWERARYPFAHNRDLLRFSLKTAAAGRQAGRPLNIVLLLDNSGSMERADRVQIIREALRVLASQLQPQDRLSVITFARTARLFADGAPGSDAGAIAMALTELTPQGGTNLEDAMNLAYQTAARHYLANGINRVVLLTDGAANLGNVEPDSLKQKVEAQRKQGIALDCFGIGWEGFNDDLLEVLSRNGDGRYGFINSPEEAATEFAAQLAGALKVAASDVKVQVEFNPRRTTAYRQIGYAKHQLTKEQFRDNTVDAAEIAAQEAGNALYTVEVNPAGEGPLGTVRVRYKIPGTTDYHEHAWDVPYTGSAVSLEQSSPAMRLAASASAFSEWLVASPFAGEVTPDALLGYLSGVPEVYGADARSKKLEWMIRQAKSLEGK